MSPPQILIGVASSTGGPTALLELFSKVPDRLSASILVAQHMPDKFTRTFAERLDKRGPYRVAEASDGEYVFARTGFVCPGRQCMEVFNVGPDLKLRTGAPGTQDRYVPSADRLFRSMATVMGPRLVGIVLTGMGDDGLAGARALKEAGGTVVVESQETAVVYGMPGAVARAGLADQILPLSGICDFLIGIAGREG